MGASRRVWAAIGIAVVLAVMALVLTGGLTSAQSSVTLTAATIAKQWDATNTVNFAGDEVVITSIYTEPGYVAVIEHWYGTVYSHTVSRIPDWPPPEPTDAPAPTLTSTATATRTPTVPPTTMPTVAPTAAVTSTIPAPTVVVTEVMTATIWGNCTGSAVAVRYQGATWGTPVQVVSNVYTITVPANVEFFLLRDGAVSWTVQGVAPNSTTRINLP